MKTILLSLLIASTGFAAEFRTQDNIDYLVSLNPELNTRQEESCLKRICDLAKSQGNANCKLVFEADRDEDNESIKIYSVNLSNIGRLAVKKLKVRNPSRSCVIDIEKENTVGNG